MVNQAGKILAKAKGKRIHLVGAKGTGVTAIAEILAKKGAILSGSDVPDIFYTDRILSELGIDVYNGFDSSHIKSDLDLVIYSEAYALNLNPELIKAAELGIPAFSYPRALGEISTLFDSSAIAGVHGKTTTTAMCGTIIEALGIEATVLAGSAVRNFGNRSTLHNGTHYFVAETCEYRRSFLNFCPTRIVLTSIEHDHQDYYPSLESIESAFKEFLCKLPENGLLIYCADDQGAMRAARALESDSPSVDLLPYGETAHGAFKLAQFQSMEGKSTFRLAGFDAEFVLHVPGRHLALDACAAIALCFNLLAQQRGALKKGYDETIKYIQQEDLIKVIEALKSFSGSKRRSEIVGNTNDILVLDDYAHHPTAIAKTIEGIKEFWPHRRLIVDFMPHTFSRTKALLDEFACAFDCADILIVHKIYASAREVFDPAINGELLFKKIIDHNPKLDVQYYPEILDPLENIVSKILQPGDIFITMGAGDNWKLGIEVLKRLSEGVLKS